MIRWLFLFLVAGIVVWMLSDSKATRIISLSVIAFFAAVAMVFFYVLDTPERRKQKTPAPDKTIAEVREITQKLEKARFALKPEDVVLLRPTLTPAKNTVWTNDGKRQETDDLFSWVAAGSVKNLSSAYTVQDIFLRVSLYDCPTYYTTPQTEVSAKELKTVCSLTGERSLGLYKLGIAPDSTSEFDMPVRFNDQIEPRNWRTLLKVESVTALVE